MSDPASSPTTGPAGTIGDQPRFRSARLSKRRDKHSHSFRSGQSRESKSQEVENGEVQNGGQPPRRVVSDPHKRLAPFASIKNRFSQRHSSGGFLVNSDDHTKHRRSTDTSTSSKGKEKENHGTSRSVVPQDDLKTAIHTKDSDSRARSAAAGTFLSHDVASGEPFTGRRSINFDERLPSPARQKSASPEPLRKPLMRNSVYNSNVPKTPESRQSESIDSPAIDPAQIVRMALNLSEGRRMHLDPGHVPSIPSSLDRRAVSAAIPARPSTTPEHRSSPRDRSSKAVSSGSVTPNGLHPAILSTSSKSSAANSSILLADEQPVYTFSPATLARADRAKAFFELANQHWRLLEQLPPLKHSSVNNTQAIQKSLGRSYNPIQFLRNREVRGSQRANLDAHKAGWEDANAVQGWVDTVEREAREEGYVESDIAHLPQWVSGTGLSTNPHSEAYQNSQSRDGPSPKRIQQRRMFWAAYPADLLADAYWLEQGDNKTQVQARNGHKIFKDFRRPARRRAGTATSHKTHETRYTASSEEAVGSGKSPDTAKFTDSPVAMDEDERRELDDVRFSPQHKSRTTRVTRHLFRKPKGHDHDEHQGSEDDSDNHSIEGFPARRGPKNTNIGPLERHMKQMIERERQGHTSEVVEPETSPQDREGLRRGGVSGESPQLDRHSFDAKRLSVQGAFRFPQQDAQPDSSTDTPRISIEDHDSRKEQDKNKSQANGHAKAPSQKPADHGEPHEVERIVNRASRLGFLRRHRHTESRTAEQDFAKGGESFTRGHPQSVTSGSDSDSEDHFASPEARSINHASSESLTREGGHGAQSPKKGQSTTRQFFKAGRIGDFVRHEKHEPGKVDSKWHGLRHKPSAALSRETFSSDTDDTKPTHDNHRGHESTGLTVPEARRSHRRSSSATGASRDQPQYHMKNLPSFVSSGTSPQKDKKYLSPYRDHISQQQEERRLQRKTSRLNELSPPKIDTSDVSPTTSSPDLTRTGTRATATSTAPTLGHVHSYGFPSGDESVSGSEQPTKSAAKRLNDALSIPGTVGKGGLPMTALSKIDARNDPVRRPGASTQGSFLSTDRPVALRSTRSSSVNKQSIAYVRSMLLASGIKASYIVRRANAPREKTPKYVVNACATAGHDLASLGSVNRQQEFAVAAQLLSEHLRSTMSAFDGSALHFRNETCRQLNARIDDLRDLVSNHLTHQVHDEGDRADAFVAQLTTTHTLSIKRLNDSVDLMMRKRRQRLRYLRRAGFTLLEWVLVGLMWGIWAMVSVVGLAKRVVGFFIGAMRWLLWLD